MAAGRTTKKPATTKANTQDTAFQENLDAAIRTAALEQTGPSVTSIKIEKVDSAIRQGTSIKFTTESGQKFQVLVARMTGGGGGEE